MKKIVVNDTNVFIDLHDVGLLEQFFLLPWEVHTTDFVMLELLNEGQKDTVAAYEHNGSLHVATFEFDEISKIDNLQKAIADKTNLSLTHRLLCMVLCQAEQLCTLDWRPQTPQLSLERRRRGPRYHICF